MYMVYDVPIQWLPEAMEQSGEDIFEKIQAVVYDPPYINRRIFKLSNLEHDRLGLEDISHFVAIILAERDAERLGTCYSPLRSLKRGMNYLFVQMRTL